MAGGRPTKYKPEYCQLFDEFMSKGKSVKQFAAHLKVRRETIYQWAKDNEEFSNIFTQAKEYAEAYWEDELQTMMYDRNINAPLAKLYFANRFGWTDKPKEEEAPKQEQQKVVIEVIGANTSN